MPRFAKDVPVGEEDEIDFVESRMRACLYQARREFDQAKSIFHRFDADPAQQSALWNRFNATMRRLMKGDDKEWM